MADPTPRPAAPTVEDPREVGDRGRLDISRRAVERIAETSALRVTGVTRQAATLGRGLPQARADLAGEHVRLKVQVAVVWGRPLADLAAEVRSQVTTTVSDLTALAVDAVNIDIAAVATQAADTGQQPERRLS